jgi:hypothetical protein
VMPQPLAVLRLHLPKLCRRGPKALECADLNPRFSFRRRRPPKL